MAVVAVRGILRALRESRRSIRRRRSFWWIRVRRARERSILPALATSARCTSGRRRLIRRNLHPVSFTLPPSLAPLRAPIAHLQCISARQLPFFAPLISPILETGGLSRPLFLLASSSPPLLTPCLFLFFAPSYEWALPRAIRERTGDLDRSPFHPERVCELSELAISDLSLVLR